MSGRGRPSDKTHDAAVRDLVLRGLSQSEIAKHLLIHPTWVYRIVKRLKLKARDARGENAGSAVDRGRVLSMAKLYANGQTLQQIGDEFGITRERVRQIIRDQTALLPRDGGQAVKTRRASAERATKKDQQCMDRLGCGWEEYKRIRDLGCAMRSAGRSYRQTPMGAFLRQRLNASNRGIGWEFNFWEWWSVWQSSGRWTQRGRGQGYVMCRRNDEGPYAPGNVFITTAIENTSSSKHKKSGLPTGVTQRGLKFEAARILNGRKTHLGSFCTPSEAYAAYVSAAPGFVPSRGVYRRSEKSA